MANKKTFASGLEALLTPTDNKITETKSKVAPVPVPSPSPDDPSVEKLVAVHFQMPLSLKIRLDTFCSINQISKRDLISNLIINHIDKNLFI